MIPRLLADIELQDLEALVADRVPEGRRLDHEDTAPPSDGERTALLKSVESLANSDAGKRWLRREGERKGIKYFPGPRMSL